MQMILLVYGICTRFYADQAYKNYKHILGLISINA